MKLYNINLSVEDERLYLKAQNALADINTCDYDRLMYLDIITEIREYYSNKSAIRSDNANWMNLVY